MLKTKLTAQAVRHHFAYSLWKYALLVVLSLFGWNLIYTSTAYRPPQDKRIDLYIQSATTSDELLEPFLTKLWQEAVPDMELVDAVQLQMSSQEDVYAIMQLTTYIAAQEGDIYMLCSDDFKRFASQGAFLELEDLAASGELNLEGIDTSAGYVTLAVSEMDELPADYQPERHLYGIPAASLFGFMNDLMIDNRDMYLSVTVNNGNDANVIPFLNALVQETRGDPPDFLTQQEPPS
ncbi:MAG: hypothetical protein GX916_11055 [Clostridiales bacterium]|jgi:hypothetical protein|nr:hypothetical protein [Clostridiales bacterium]